MKKRLWLVASLLLIMALLVGGCASKAIKPLTNTEKDRFIEIALNTPEALRYLENESKYEIEVRWVALGWEDSKATEWHPLDYEEIADGNLPSDRLYLSQTVTIHPEVYIRVGEPVRMFISVAFDRDTQEVVHVELLPGRLTRGPTPAHGSIVITMEVTYTMRGEQSQLIIFEDGAVRYIEEKGLRFPTPGSPAIRIKRKGQLPEEELSSLIEFFRDSHFDGLDESYSWSSVPQTDMNCTISIDYQDLTKTIRASGYLTYDGDMSYPDMPYPLNEIYSKLKNIAENQTEESYRERIRD